MHAGSLVAALGSYLSARSQGGRWLLRIEDLDPPREVAGAADTIRRQLEALDLHWDGEPWFQSQRSEAYAAALADLDSAGLVFRCTCGRKLLKRTAAEGIDGIIYPGTCRYAARSSEQRHALRMRVGDGMQTFVDRWRGLRSCDRREDLGDFIVRRSDGLYSYPLAAAVDDAAQGITEVVRGADLLPATHKQRLVQEALGYTEPTYGHLPMLLDPAGAKLSKSEGAAALDLAEPTTALCSALAVLGQALPEDAANMGAEGLLAWSVAHWAPAQVPSCDLRLPA